MAQTAVRFTFGRDVTGEQLDGVADALAAVLA